MGKPKIELKMVIDNRHGELKEITLPMSTDELKKELVGFEFPAVLEHESNINFCISRESFYTKVSIPQLNDILNSLQKVARTEESLIFLATFHNTKEYSMKTLLKDYELLKSIIKNGEYNIYNAKTFYELGREVYSYGILPWETSEYETLSDELRMGIERFLDFKEMGMDFAEKSGGSFVEYGEESYFLQITMFE